MYNITYAYQPYTGLASYTINYIPDAQFNTKATFVASYFDNICRGAIKAFEAVNSIGGAKPNLIVGSWGHNGYVNSLDSVGKFKITNAQANVGQHLVQHFQSITSEEQRIQAYVIRKDEWIKTNECPLKQPQLNFHLCSMRTKT